MLALKKLIIVFSCVILLQAYVEIQQTKLLMNFYEENSHYPIVHVYHNRHFSKSRQFQEFLEVLEEVEYRNKDFVKFILSDCEKKQQGQTYSCDEMRRTKDNRMILGYYPSSDFVNFAGKKMQNPPLNKNFDHPKDVYTVEQFDDFIQKMLPNFYQQLSNMDQYLQWLNPVYSPKLIFASGQDQIPLVIKQLGVNYFLKFDLGFVSDLTESVIQHLNITKFPTLMVLHYDFDEEIFLVDNYEGTQFMTHNYQQIKSFLEPFALVQPRNDLLFHKMKIPKSQQIFQTDSNAELKKHLDQANGWVIISQSNDVPTKLKDLKDKYGRYFQYVHVIRGEDNKQQLTLYEPEKKKSFGIDNQIKFNALTSEQFLTNVTVWLNKNYVIIGVRQQYGHICTISQSTFFRGLTHCLIVKQTDYDAVKDALNMPFDYGFACYQKIVNETKKITGQVFKNQDYEEVYLTAEYQTRMKAKDIIDIFFQQPIKPIERTEVLSQICAFPTKKCAILFTNSNKKDRTAYEYLEAAAQDFINEYLFYEVDLAVNPQFLQEIPSLEKHSGGLIVYHPKYESYVNLKAKLSQTTFQKFLKANLIDNKKLPFHRFNNQKIEIYPSNKADKKTEKRSQSDSL